LLFLLLLVLLVLLLLLLLLLLPLEQPLTAGEPATAATPTLRT